MSKDQQDIDTKILKDMKYIKLINMSAEQKEKMVDRKITELSKSFHALGKHSYGGQLKTVFKSPNYLVIERLIIDKFSNRAISSYIREVFENDPLSKLSQSSLESYISKLRQGLDNSRLLIKAYSEDKKKASHYEDKLNKAIDEVGAIAYLANLQNERIKEMRQREKEDDEYNKELKKEIEVAIKLIRTSSDMKEILGVNQASNKNPIEEFRGRISNEFSRILNKKSARNIRTFISSLTNLPHESNIITEGEAEEISPYKAGDVISLKQVKEDFDAGKYNPDDVFFDVSRKQSTLLSMGIRDSADVDLIDSKKLVDKYSLAIQKHGHVDIDEDDELIEDGLDDEDDMIESEETEETDELEDFE